MKNHSSKRQYAKPKSIAIALEYQGVLCESEIVGTTINYDSFRNEDVWE